MKRWILAACAVTSATLLMGASTGDWLRRVSPRDHARTNPLATSSEAREHAALGGRQIFHQECAKCHGEDGGGLYNRPPGISDRVDHATDGDLFWLMTNGSPWKGMPTWEMLPAAQRWQLVAYLRTLNLAEDRAGEAPPATPQNTGEKQ